MAITDTQKVDYLWKKLGYAATKSDTNAAKKAPNEAISSPLQLRADKVMKDAGSIPGIQPGSSTGVVIVYPTSAPIELTADGTSAANRTWKTGLTGWIPPQFGSTYIVNVYIHTSSDASNAASISNKVFVTGSGNNDEWFFDYESGVLNFIGSNYPNGVNFSGKSVYIEGARYTGTYGTGGGTGTLGFSGNTISPNSSGDDLTLDVDGAGNVVIDTDTAIVVPVGTNAQRPTSPVKGMLRFNDDSDKIEVYDGTDWVAVGSSAGAISTQSFTGNGSDVNFTLNSSADSATVMVTLNGVVQEPTTSYTMAGNTLTLSAPLALSSVMNVIKMASNTVASTVADANTLNTFAGSYYLDYTNFTNTPTIPTVPTNVSAFTNDSGYITNAELPTNHMVNDANNTVAGSISPSQDATYDLGTATEQWNVIYGHTVEATYADLAERYSADAPYEPGTVLVFGGEAEITTTTMIADTKVVGIVSTDPALKMNSAAGNSQTHPYIALKGRVPCKVIGKVEKGDLLVTSDRPGYAKTSLGVPMIGTVIGKAIEAKPGTGEGIVEVFVSMM